MKSKGRPVEVNQVWFDKARGRQTKRENGTFHCWGLKKSKDYQNPKMVTVETVAVVEMPDGNVKCFKPEFIKFMGDNL